MSRRTIWTSIFVITACGASLAANAFGQETPDRSEAEVRKLIDEAGRSQPEWWDDVQLNYPNTLDLNWPFPAPGGWNASKNVGQYLWERINPNPSRWREGIRFVHFLLVKHENNADVKLRAMKQLGSMYYNLERDYARAAFWWEKAGVAPGQSAPATITKLADCYRRLGGKQLAYDALNKSPIYYDTIKVLADMGQTKTAVALAERIAKYSTARADLAFLYAGDACRQVGQYDTAVGYYEKVVATRPPSTQQRMVDAYERSKQRARDSIMAIKVFENLDLSRVPDGSYEDHAPGYAGDVYVKVVVSGGRIDSVAVTKHKEKQFFTSITDTPRKIVEKQGVQGVDAVTGATITSEAIVHAVAKALASAQ